MSVGSDAVYYVYVGAESADLIHRIRAFNASGEHRDPRGFGIGAAGFPEGHPETPNQLRQMGHLKAKVDAGVDWITTQMKTSKYWLGKRTDA